MSRVTPIKPAEVKEAKLESIPDKVIEIVNIMITAKFHNGKAVVHQSDLVAEIVREMKVPRESIFDQHWLDFESLYRDAGWVVKYDKGAWNDTASETFTFEVK